MNTKLEQSDVARNCGSRLEAVLSVIRTSELWPDIASQPVERARDAPASMAFRCLPMLDWPPNLFA